MILSIFNFFTVPYNFFLEKKNSCKFYIFQKMNLLPQFFLEMVVIGLLGGVGGRAGVVGHGRAWSGRAWSLLR